MRRQVEELQSENRFLKDSFSSLSKKIEKLEESAAKSSKEHGESVRGLYKGVDNLTQFLNDIQNNQIEQSRRIKNIEADFRFFERRVKLNLLIDCKSS